MGQYLKNVLVHINVKIDVIIEIEDVTLTSPDVNLIWTFIREDELMFVPEQSVLLAELTNSPNQGHTQ